MTPEAAPPTVNPGHPGHRAARVAAALLVVLLQAPAAWACPACRVQARERAFGPDFVETAVLLLLPLLVIAGVGVLLHFSDRPSGPRHAAPPDR